MAQNYIEYQFTVVPKEPWEEILLAALQELPFESFDHSETSLLAYVPEMLHFEGFLNSISLFEDPSISISVKKKTIKPVNWNAKWESEFQPIVIGDNCVVRADFHPDQGKRFELIINPKMSFGTGHHQTTHMMLDFALSESFEGKSILDMGCGTGVLAILASMKGAVSVDAIDLDPWCIENATENALKNNCSNVNCVLGSSLTKDIPTYGLIFANINRNILLEQISSYSLALIEGGVLLLSGFYQSDIESLRQCCEAEGLSYEEEKQKGDWCALKFVK
ncbi:50S ribosomal protein L11 methyltransferase [Flavobacteriaceae bacterium]|jgi:ribosomal protein L11 methyltransferase|nr:50S ribosomal protein L11 methyltransferase [Flavobacteriaceae bacterium]